VVGIVDLGGILDVAHSLRGKKRLMIDLFRSPDEVKALCWRVLDIWHECYEELYSITQPNLKGTSAWMGLWSDDRWYPLQCDYAYMLSPRKFEEFVYPFVAEQCRRLDHSVYHLDGYGQIPHLDRFLEIPGLDAIQWVPGAGKPGCGSREYYPMYEKIKAAGKGVVVNLSPDEIEPMCRAIGPEGLMFQTGCRSEQEARTLLSDAETWW
jgi:5-methyltetrahydrofolate--homocysteine methyltransferase